MTDLSVQGDITSSAQAPEAATPTTVSQPSNLQTLSQDRIDAIVRDAHHRGYSKRDKELNAQQQPVQQPVQQQQAPAQNQAFNPDEMRRMAAEEAAKAVQQTQMQMQADAVINQFQTKMQLAAAKYPDFAQKVNQLDFSRMVDLVQMTSQMENTGDIMYDLASNPFKIANLQQLAQIQPGLAMSELQKLSASINNNQKPAPQLPNAPSQQISSSPTGIGTDGLPTHEHFSARYRG